MTPKNPKKRQESALGKGLDALIRRDYLDEEKERLEEKVDEKAKNDLTETDHTDTGVDETQNVQEEAVEPETSESAEKSEPPEILETSASQTLNVDDKIVEDVLLEVYKNPRISLWSARSAAVLRFLKKTKPEFSISNEASLLIEAAVKDRHPDIWKIFEEKGL